MPKLYNIMPGQRFVLCPGGTVYMAVHEGAFVRIVYRPPSYASSVGFVPVVGVKTGEVIFMDGEVQTVRKGKGRSENAK